MTRMAMTRMAMTRMPGMTTIRGLPEQNADIAMALEIVLAQIVIMDVVVVATERAILIAETTSPLAHGVKEENVRHVMAEPVARSAMAKAICNQSSDILA